MPEIVGRLRSPRLSVAPATPAVGELYYNTANNKLYWWNGTAWIDATGGAALPAVVNGQFLKGSGGAAVWSQILNTDLTDGIRSQSGANQIRIGWVGSTVQFWVDSINAKQLAMNVFGPYAVASGSIAAGSEATVTVGHGLGITPVVAAVQLEDGSFAGRCTWRKGTFDTTNASFVIFNPTATGAAATVTLRCVLFA